MNALINFFRPHLLPLLYALVIVLVLPLITGYVVLLERKVMADMQARLGPMRVGPHGLLQPIADALKLLIKEDIIPESADLWIFWLAPVLSVTAAMLAMSALPFGPAFQIADLNIGLLFILGISSMGIYGIVLGGWASNSNYSLLGALRSSAQLVSYETAAGMALVSGLLLAGYMTEYSGFRWALYFLAEYANMIVVAAIATTIFLGGWLRPFSGVRALDFLDYLPPLLMLLIGGYCFLRVPRQPAKVQRGFLAAVGLLCFGLAGILGIALLPPAAAFKPGIHGGFWFLLKVFFYIYVFMWLRFTFPRYRFDQLMRLGWHFMIPVALVNVMAIGLALVLHRQFGWGLAPALVVTTVGTLLAAGYLAYVGQQSQSAFVGGA